MNKVLKSLLTVIAVGATALGLSAQPAPKIVTIDMGKLLEGHYKTEDFMTKFRGRQQQVQTDFEKMLKERDDMVEKFKEAAEQAKNTMLTAEARTKAEGDAKKLLEDAQRKDNDVQEFRNSNTQALQKQFNDFRGTLVEEVVKKVADIAKAKGATIVLDRSGPTQIGISNIVYADASYDITDEVLVAINKDRPATATAPAPAPATATPAAAPAAAVPTVTVPGLAPKK